MKPAKLVFARKCHVCDVTAGAGLATHGLAKIIGDNIVELWLLPSWRARGPILTIDAIEYFYQLKNTNCHPGLFQQFAGNTFFQRLTEFQSSAWNRPLAAQGLAAAANK